MENPILLLGHFLQNLLICVLVIGVAFRLSNRYQDYLKFALIGGLIVYITRNIFIMLGLNLGLNALITLVITAFIYKQIFKTNFKISLVLSLLGYFMVFATEILTVQVTLDFMGITAKQMFTHSSLHLQVGLIQNLILTLWGIPCVMINQFINLVRRKDITLEP